jgi:hypothetical protein
MTRMTTTTMMMMTRKVLQVLFFCVLGCSTMAAVESFQLVSSQVSVLGKQPKLTTTTQLWLSDVPQDDTNNANNNSNNKKEESLKNKTTRKTTDERLERPRHNRNNSNNNDNNNNNFHWLPEPPQDHLTLAGDMASLFLYAFLDHFTSQVYLTSLLATSTSAAEAAKRLDPMLHASTPVWLDSTALSPHSVEQILFLDLESRVMPHFTSLLDSAGMASVSLASCWLLAGLIHQAFHFRNTLDCSTHRVIRVTGQTWLTACVLLVVLTSVSQHCWINIMMMTGQDYAAAAAAVAEVGGDTTTTTTTTTVSTLILMTEGRIITPLEEWFRVLSRADCDYIFNSLGVLLWWRFLLSFLLGGWNKNDE